MTNVNIFIQVCLTVAPHSGHWNVQKCWKDVPDVGSSASVTDWFASGVDVVPFYPRRARSIKYLPNYVFWTGDIFGTKRGDSMPLKQLNVSVLWCSSADDCAQFLDQLIEIMGCIEQSNLLSGNEQWTHSVARMLTIITRWKIFVFVILTLTIYDILK